MDGMSLPEMVEALEEKFGSLNRASRKSDIPTTTLFKIKRGQVRDPRISTLGKIADALDQNLPDMLRRFGVDGSGSH